ncbi:MAG TPA: phosphate ABC transporter substrate-binding protein [Gammaproteobacteria bacterium]|nr:phosphate ABC transporter substrate-binding protein [Gammaproteobacteria bacterium]
MAVGLALFLVSQASAGVVVIVSPDSSLDGLSKSQIKSVFLGKVKNLPNGEAAVPVNQAESSPVYDAFNQKVLGKSSAKVLQYWASRVFSGKGSPPEVVPDDKAVIEFVKSKKGAIGYIDSASADDSVKVIYSAD